MTSQATDSKTQPLLQKIVERLSKKPSCTIFETEIEKQFPINNLAKQEQIAEILAFAKANDLVASVRDPGIRVTFRKR